jgi:uncharacterized repeat protein (TIGR01451 family)
MNARFCSPAVRLLILSLVILSPGALFAIPTTGTVQFITDVYGRNENAGNAALTVTRNGDTNSGCSVNWSVTGGSAVALNDYSPTSGTLNFAAGETFKNISLLIVDDALVESNETVNLTLSGAVNATISFPSNAVLTIFDNDVSNPPPATVVQFITDVYGRSENAGDASLTVTRSGDTSNACSVNWSVTGGSATSVADYSPASGTLNFAAFETFKNISLFIVDDGIVESNETVNLTLSGAVNATIGFPSNAVLTIFDNDVSNPPPVIQFVSSVYGRFENQTAPLNLERLGDTNVSCSVQWSYTGGTAAPFSDFFGGSSTINFAAGQTIAALPISIIDDAVAEPDETAGFSLQNPFNATLGTPSSATLTIYDNDVSNPPPATVVQFITDVYGRNENAGDASLTVTRSGDTSNACSVNWSVTGGSATSVADYSPASGTLNFAAFETFKNISLFIVDDGIVESNETVNLTLSGAVNATIGFPSNAVLTIFDNDVTNPPPAADVSMRKTGPAGSVNVGQQITYTLYASNAGPNISSNVIVRDAIPSGTVYVNATGGACTFYPNFQRVDCDVGNLASGGSAIVSVTVQVTNSGDIVNFANAYGTTPDPNTDNNASGVTNTAVVPTADVSMRKTGPAGSVNVGQQITYTLYASNAGPNISSNVIVRDAIPSGTVYVNATGGACTFYPNFQRVDCDVGNLASGGSAIVSVTVQVTNSGDIVNFANTPDPNTDNNASGVTNTAVVTGADIAVGKSANVATMTNGGYIQFYLYATNLGPNVASNVVIREILPPGLQAAGSAVFNGQYYDSINGYWYITNMPVGNVATLTVSAQAVANGTHTNTASLNTSQPGDTNSANNAASVVVTVTGGSPAGQADLLLLKSADVSSVTVSQALTFEIYIQNDGPDAATNVVVQEYLPPGLVVLSNSAPAGTSYSPGTGQWTIPGLANGASATLTLTVARYTTGTVSNHVAIVSSGTSDPNPFNNSSGVEVTWTPPMADVAVIKSVTPTLLNPNGQIEFTLLVDNAGPDPATAVVLQDVLPPGVSVLSAIPSQGSCTLGAGFVSCGLGNLSSGASVSISIVATVSAGGTFTNSATVTAQETDPNVDNNSASAIYIVRNEFTVTGTAGANGTITPDGTASYIAGGNAAFYANPSVNYLVDAWYLDGVLAQTGGDSYILHGIQANHTVHVTFRFVPPCQGLAVNFVDADHGDDDTLPGDAVAGAFPQASWINVSGPAGNLLLTDGVTVNWSASATRSLAAANLSPDYALMQGYLDSGSNQTTIAVSGISYASYDVYVYAAGDNTPGSPTGGNETRVGRYTLNGSLSRYAKDDPSQPDFAGLYTEATSTTGGPGASVGNYVLFQNVSGASFTLAASSDYTSGATRSAPVNAIQIVPRNVSTPGLLRFTSIVRSNATVLLELSGAANTQVDIESSEDLAFWTPVASLFNTNGTLRHNDVLDPAGPARFYRAVQGGVPNTPIDLAFEGNSPEMGGSEGTLLLRGDLNQMQFSWQSSDSIFGSINTGFLNASNWNVVPGTGACPARVTFSGFAGGIQYVGTVIFGAYNRAVIELNRTVTNVVQRGRYGLIRVTLDLTLYKSDNVTPLPQNKELNPGGFLPVNNDDDNRNGTKDKADDDGEGGEDDMLRLELTRPLPPLLQQKGLLYLRKVNAGTNDNSSRIKIWKSLQKHATNLVLDVNQREKIWDLAVPAQRTELAGLLTNLWVEGVAGSGKPRDVELQWAYRDSAAQTNDLAREAIRLTVIEFQTQASEGLDAQNRIFTAWSGPPKNRGEAPPVTLATRIAQQGLPANFLVRWYAHDYEDPAQHVHTDPNDKFAKEPRLPGEKAGYQPPEVGGYRANWRDNSGIVTAAAMFAEKAGFALNGGVTSYSQAEAVPAAIGGFDRPVQNYTWREAETKTALDAGRISKVIFNATDNRGDNFLIHVGFEFDGFSFLCHLQQDTTMNQKPLTVWTKQQAVVYAMNRAVDANRVVVVPGPNGIIEPGYDARDKITGGTADARQARVEIGNGNTELFSRPRGNDRIIGTIEPKVAADGLNHATVAGMNGMDVLRGKIVAGTDGKIEKATVLSGGANDDHSMLKIEKGTNATVMTPKHTNDVLDVDGNIVAGPDKILDSAANLAVGDIITGEIREGTDAKLDSRPADANDVVLGTIEGDAGGVLRSRPIPDTDVGRKDRVVGYIDSGDPTGAKAGNPNLTCLDIKPGYLRNSQQGAVADDDYVWVGGKPVIVAGGDGDCDTLAIADDVNILAPGNDGVYYPFDGGENLGSRFDYMKKTYAQPNGTESWGYMDLEIYDATNRASYASDFTRFEDDLGNGYALANGQTLILKVDGGANQTITFNNANFADITKATTAEIVAVINTAIPGLARRLVYGRDGVSSHVCLRATTSIEVTGGTALGALGFATEKVTRNHTRFIADISDDEDGRTGLPGLLHYELYFRGQSDVHGSDAKDPAHSPDVVSIYGVRSTDNNGTFGATDRQPHSLINVGLHEQKGIIRNDTVCHEPGHSWAQPGENIVIRGKDSFHRTHTSSAIAGGVVTYDNGVVRGSPNEPCQWSNKQGNDAGALCPWHMRQLRNSMYRTWTGTDARSNRD